MTTRQRLGDWVREIGVTDQDVRPNHAWRHSFKRKASRAGIDRGIPPGSWGVRLWLGITTGYQESLESHLDVGPTVALVRVVSGWERLPRPEFLQSAMHKYGYAARRQFN